MPTPTLLYETINGQKEAHIIMNKSSINGLEARKFTEEIVNKLDKDIKVIVIDISNVKFISSAGLGMIVNAYVVFKRNNVPIRIVGASCDVKKLFSITKIDTLIEIS